MYLASRNYEYFASCIGTGSGEQLQTMILAGKSNQQIANAMGCDVKHLAWAMSQPAPQPLAPANWTSVNTGPYPYPGPWFGIAPIVYSGPGPVGFTYGPPVSARTFTVGGDFS